jgi:hypothetical protein
VIKIVRQDCLSIIQDSCLHWYFWLFHRNLIPMVRYLWKWIFTFG